MRVMLKANMCTEKANQLARDGRLASTIQTIVENAKPEAVFFTDGNGKRTAYLFLQMSDSSEIPKYAEPWMLSLDAEIELHPVMNFQDLGKAEAHIQQAVKTCS